VLVLLPFVVSKGDRVPSQEIAHGHYRSKEALLELDVIAFSSSILESVAQNVRNCLIVIHVIFVLYVLCTSTDLKKSLMI
jgi:hypothetical protein